MRSIIHRTALSATLLGGALCAQVSHATDFATVVSSTPVTASVQVPRQVCSEGQQWVQAPPSGAGALIGAVAGGVIGSTLGGGFGRAVATGVGAMTGAVVGNQVEANANPVAAVPVRHCQTVSSVETRVVGYDVMYDYAGQRYSTRMARDPGQQVAVNVQAVESGGATVPAPVERAQEGVPVPLNSAPAAAASTTVIYANAPQPVYYYAAPPAVYLAPTIGFGLGYYGGYYGRYYRGGYGGYRGGYVGHH